MIFSGGSGPMVFLALQRLARQQTSENRKNGKTNVIFIP
jgi:hypothetical protein